MIANVIDSGERIPMFARENASKGILASRVICGKSIIFKIQKYLRRHRDVCILEHLLADYSRVDNNFCKQENFYEYNVAT